MIRVPHQELLKDIGETRDRAAALERDGAVHLSRFLRNKSPEALLERSMRIWDGYHTRVVARHVGPNVVAEDPTLLLYYQNRLLDYAEAIASDDDQAAAHEIHLLGVKM